MFFSIDLGDEHPYLLSLHQGTKEFDIWFHVEKKSNNNEDIVTIVTKIGLKKKWRFPK